MKAPTFQIAILLLAATVTACQPKSPVPNPPESQAPTPEPQFVHPFVVDEFAVRRLLLVYDPSGVLTAVRDAPVSDAPRNIWWQSVPGDPHDRPRLAWRRVLARCDAHHRAQ